jgi:hypothetical protein
MKKEVGVVRKRIDTVNKELKPLGQTCQKKVEFYKFFFLILLTIVVFYIYSFYISKKLVVN